MALQNHYITIDTQQLRFCNTKNKEAERLLIIKEFSFSGFMRYPMPVRGYEIFVPPHTPLSNAPYYAIRNPKGTLLIMGMACSHDGNSNKIKCVAKVCKGAWVVSC